MSLLLINLVAVLSENGDVDFEADDESGVYGTYELIVTMMLMIMVTVSVTNGNGDSDYDYGIETEGDCA